MHDFANTVLWIYILLLLVGGLIGFFKGKSKVSLVTSVIAAVLLALTALPGILDQSFADKLANVILLALLVVFTLRLAKTKKFMPGGLMLVLTIVALALRNLKFH
jgi:uncharacterized membrane protein (UPF0136 family)